MLTLLLIMSDSSTCLQSRFPKLVSPISQHNTVDGIKLHYSNHYKITDNKQFSCTRSDGFLYSEENRS